MADVATIGVPHDDWGEEVRSVVQPREDVEGTAALAQELIDFCRENLAHFKCPRGVDFAEELPRHDTGKISRRRVRESYWVGRERKI